LKRQKSTKKKSKNNVTNRDILTSGLNATSNEVVQYYEPTKVSGQSMRNGTKMRFIIDTNNASLVRIIKAFLIKEQFKLIELDKNEEDDADKEDEEDEEDNSEAETVDQNSDVVVEAVKRRKITNKSNSPTNKIMNIISSPIKNPQKYYKDLAFEKYRPKYLEFKVLIEKIEASSFKNMLEVYQFRAAFDRFHNETKDINCGRIQGYVLRDSKEVNTLIVKAYNILRATCNRSNVICKKGISKDGAAFCPTCLKFSCKYCYDKSITDGFTGCPNCKKETTSSREHLADLGAEDDITLSDILEYKPAISSMKW